jgi:hypothetical protein
MMDKSNVCNFLHTLPECLQDDLRRTRVAIHLISHAHQQRSAVSQAFIFRFLVLVKKLCVGENVGSPATYDILTD